MRHQRVSIHSPVQCGSCGHTAGDQGLGRISGKRNFRRAEQEGDEGKSVKGDYRYF